MQTQSAPSPSIIPPQIIYRTEDEFEKLIESPYPVTVSFLVTPELAAWMLLRNTKNRTPSKDQVSHYARQMREGKWEVGDPIQFGTNGEALNGGHRLQAVIQAKVPVRMFVSFGVAPRFKEVADTGKRRTNRSFLEMFTGEEHADLKASCCRKLYGLIHGPKQIMTTEEMMALVKQFRPSMDAIFPHVPRTSKAGNLRRGEVYLPLILVYGMGTEVQKQKVLTFARAVMKGEMLKEGDPALVVRDWFITGKAETYDNGDWQRGISRVLNALAFHLLGESMESLRPKQGIIGAALAYYNIPLHRTVADGWESQENRDGQALGQRGAYGGPGFMVVRVQRDLRLVLGNLKEGKEHTLNT